MSGRADQTSGNQRRTSSLPRMWLMVLGIVALCQPWSLSCTATA